MFKKFCENNRGSALATALIGVLAISMFGFAMMQYSHFGTVQSAYEEREKQAYYMARTGLKIMESYIEENIDNPEALEKVIYKGSDPDEGWSELTYFPGKSKAENPDILNEQGFQVKVVIEKNAKGEDEIVILSRGMSGPSLVDDNSSVVVVREVDNKDNPINPGPNNPDPKDPDPKDPDPKDPDPKDPDPKDPDPNNPDPNNPNPKDPDPKDPDPKDPDPKDPDPKDPDPKDPNPKDPDPKDPDPKDPDPKDPNPKDPDPKDPDPKDPDPKDPDPKDPDPKDPNPKDPDPKDPDPKDPDPTDKDPKDTDPKDPDPTNPNNSGPSGSGSGGKKYREETSGPARPKSYGPGAAVSYRNLRPEEMPSLYYGGLIESSMPSAFFGSDQEYEPSSIGGGSKIKFGSWYGGDGQTYEDIDDSIFSDIEFNGEIKFTDDWDWEGFDDFEDFEEIEEVEEP